MASEQPWRPAEATTEIRKLAREEKLTMTFTRHALERLAKRGLTTSDALYVLKNGFVYEAPEGASRPGFFKYQVESRSPNDARDLRVVAIPFTGTREIKLVTVMFVDET